MSNAILIEDDDDDNKPLSMPANQLLAQLHRERASRKNVKTKRNTKAKATPARKDSAALATIHEQRVKNMQHVNNEEQQQASPATIAPSNNNNTLRKKPTNLKEEMRLARERHKKKWKSNAPKAMTLSDLQSKQAELERAKAGDQGSHTSPSSSRNQVHTIANTLHDPERIGREALQFTNEFRAKQGLPPCTWSTALTRIGAKHSKDMGDGQVPFGHAGFDARVRAVPFAAQSVSENVAMNNSSSDVARVAVDGWIDSPGHRKNMLGKCNYCGIAVYQNASGMFYLTQLFALGP